MVWLVIWVVLMLFWVLHTGYVNYAPDKPFGPVLLGSLIPWLCVLLLGLVVFGAISLPPRETTTVVYPVR